MITAQQIKSARLNAGLTQTQAAAIVSKHWRSWQRYEAGDRNIDPATWELFLLKTAQKTGNFDEMNTAKRRAKKISEVNSDYQIENGVSRMPDVEAMTGIKRTLIYKLIREGKFPKQTKVGERVSAWKNADLVRFINGDRDWGF